MSASVHALPPIYRIAYATDGGCGLVDGFSSRRRWEAETALWLMSEQHPGIFFWITTCIA